MGIGVKEIARGSGRVELWLRKNVVSLDFVGKL
jgi:hypothetical protein